MKPAELRAEDFEHYAPEARAFAQSRLALLQKLPLAICPSFLEQIEQLDSSFPAERATLRRMCDFLAALPASRLTALTEPFDRIRLSSQLEKQEWVRTPAQFIAELTAELWSSGQIDRFREASVALFAAVPAPEDHPDRLTVVVLGQDARAPASAVFRKLGSKGVTLTAMEGVDMPGQIFAAFRKHAEASAEPYAHWYVDGGEPWKDPYRAIAGTVAVSYPELDPVRVQTLGRMEQIVRSGNAGAEEMRARLATMTPQELGTDSVTLDPVLRRFYTELFTQSSGPQIFSTTFVQWTGRELARRAQPRTLLLRYAPRRRYEPFNEMLRATEPASLDPAGSLRDAEMGAYYTWIDMNRITTTGKTSFVAWLEGTSRAVIIGNSAPAGTESNSPLNLEQALKAFC
ncbi:MAG: hypothetical protein WB622_00905 [Acidobacteriaceae bacterium]